MRYQKLKVLALAVSFVSVTCDSPIAPGPSDIFYYTTASEYHPDTVNYRDVIITSILTNLRTDTLGITTCPYTQFLQIFKNGEWVDYYPPPMECSTISIEVLPSRSVELQYPLYPGIPYPKGLYRLVVYYGSSSSGRGGSLHSNGFYIKW